MKNIHILKSEKASKLHLKPSGFYLTKEENSYIPYSYPQNVYITSDEEIKDWFIYKSENKTIVLKAKTINSHTIIVDSHIEVGTWVSLKCCKKIILTTDQDLIKDGVQSIDDEFLEWFLRNPDCKYIEVQKILGCVDLDAICYFGDTSCPNAPHCHKSSYKIVIPKRVEEKYDFFKEFKKYFENTPKEKILEDWNKSAYLDLDHIGPTVEEFINNSIEERLKEAAEKLYQYKSKNPPYTIITPKDKIEGFIEGALSEYAKDYWYQTFTIEQNGK
jgi:hypothetical protein